MVNGFLGTIKQCAKFAIAYDRALLEAEQQLSQLDMEEDEKMQE